MPPSLRELRSNQVGGDVSLLTLSVALTAVHAVRYRKRVRRSAAVRIELLGRLSDRPSQRTTANAHSVVVGGPVAP
jgi:hypothetical protein